MSVNKALVLGNLTRDPELRYTPQGTAVCEFGLALNRRRSKGSDREPEVCFIDIVAWARTAELCAEHLKKGRAVFVEGRLIQDRWETSDGRKMTKIRIGCERIEFVGPKRPEPDDESASAVASIPKGRREELDRQAQQEDIPF